MIKLFNKRIAVFFCCLCLSLAIYSGNESVVSEEESYYTVKIRDNIRGDILKRILNEYLNFVFQFREEYWSEYLPCFDISFYLARNLELRMSIEFTRDFANIWSKPLGVIPMKYQDEMVYFLVRNKASHVSYFRLFDLTNPKILIPQDKFKDSKNIPTISSFYTITLDSFYRHDPSLVHIYNDSVKVVKFIQN